MDPTTTVIVSLICLVIGGLIGFFLATPPHGIDRAELKEARIRSECDRILAENMEAAWVESAWRKKIEDALEESRAWRDSSFEKKNDLPRDSNMKIESP